MAKTHSSLTGADLHDNKGIGVETSANFMTISQSTNILSASAASTASFGRFEGSGDSHFSGSVTFGGDLTIGDAASDSVSITADLTSHLIPNADATYDLGSTSQGWNDLHLGSGGVINLDGGDVTMTHSANLVSIAGGNTRVIRLEIDSANDYLDVDTDLKIISAADVVVDPGGGELKVDGNVVPNSDSADSLGASGTAWLKLWVDDIDLAGQGSISMGGTGRIDLDADDDTSIRASADDVITFEAGGADEMSLSATSLYPATDDGLGLGSANQNWSDLFIADEGVINFGDDQDVSLTHVLDTGLLLSSSDKLQFGDSGTFIHQSGDGVLTIESDTTVDINGAVAFDGALSGITNITLTGTISDGNYTFDTSGNVSGLGTVGCGAITTSGNLAVTGTITGDTSLTLDTTTLTTAELGVLDSVTAGTAAASKALVLDASKDIGTIRNLTIDGTFSDGNYTFDTSGNVSGIGTVGCGAITSTGNSSFAGGVTVGGDFTVNGTTVTVDATTLNVADKNITIASGSTTSANMNGAGLNFGLDAAIAQLAYRHSDTTLTSSVDLGAPQFHSSITTGTAPLTVQSTTVVSNLNADKLDGQEGSYYTDFSNMTVTAGEITHAMLAGDLIDGDNIGDDVVNSEHYAAGSIDHEHLANDIIDGDNIQDDVINSEHYAAGSIDHEHLANDIIDADNIQDDVVNSEHLAAGGIDDEHLSDGVATGLAGAGMTASSGVLNVIGGTGITANADEITTTDGDIVHDNLSGFVADEHIAHSGVSISAGGILSGGGTIAASRTITLASSDVVHDSTTGFVANEHIDHTGVTLTAGDGMTGGGTIASNRTFTVVGGNGITANSDDVAVTPAQTTITSIYNTGLKVGYDASDNICFATGSDGQISYYQNGIEEFRMTAGGTFHADADVVAYSSTVASDMNLKENITDTKYGLDDIMKLRGVDYDWKREDMGHDVGVLAQEVEAVIPEIVKEYDGLKGSGKFKAVDYNKLVPVLIESIKELKSEIDELKLIKN